MVTQYELSKLVAWSKGGMMELSTLKVSCAKCESKTNKFDAVRIGRDYICKECAK